MLKFAKLYTVYGVISYGKCGLSSSIIKLHEEKSYHVSLPLFRNQNPIHVAFNLSDNVTRAYQFIFVSVSIIHMLNILL